MPPKNKKNLSSPGTSPQYKPGAVMAIKPQNTIADYQKRLAQSYKTPIGKKVAPLPVNTGVGEAANKEYMALMEKYKGDLAKQKQAAFALYNKNKTALESGLGSTRETLTKQRGADLEGITESYAARGIGRSSGVYKQAGTDYETNYSQRLKDIEDNYKKQLQQEEGTQKEAVTGADAEYQESMADAAARKAAALEATKKEAVATAAPKAKPLPKAISPVKAAPKKQPKLTQGR